MNKVKNKLELLDEFMASLELSELDAIELWKQSGRLEFVVVLKNENSVLSDGCIPLKKSNLSKIRVGMIWYEDDTVSFERIDTKKVKAVIEYMDSNKIYGDLTASELHDIQEQEFVWGCKQDLVVCPYKCKKYECFFRYSLEELRKVYKTYNIVDKTFYLLGKKPRCQDYGSRTMYKDMVWMLSFGDGRKLLWGKKYDRCYHRPVLKFELQ